MASEILQHWMISEVDLRLGTTLRDVSWNTYQRLRDEPAYDGLRMTYLDGTLIAMSPEYIHEGNAEALSAIVRAVADAFDIDFASAGSTTFRRAADGDRKPSGKEPDASFYFGVHEALIRNKKSIDLDVDPPPDLAIEVDHKSDSGIALPVYATLQVPEVWRYHPRKGTLWFGRLVGKAYESIDQSLWIPMLTPSLVMNALKVFEQGIGERAWLGWLRAWAEGLAEGRTD